MSAAKHTPGPWETGGRIVVGDGMVVADCGEGAESNARLIAAAPELLDALSAIVARWDFDALEDTPPTIVKARQVIDKATGGAA
jgi:hypothetical protein